MKWINLNLLDFFSCWITFSYSFKRMNHSFHSFHWCNWLSDFSLPFNSLTLEWQNGPMKDGVPSQKPKGSLSWRFNVVVGLTFFPIRWVKKKKKPLRFCFYSFLLLILFYSSFLFTNSCQMLYVARLLSFFFVKGVVCHHKNIKWKEEKVC